jgi:hypothetical protein
VSRRCTAGSCTGAEEEVGGGSGGPGGVGLLMWALGRLTGLRVRGDGWVYGPEGSGEEVTYLSHLSVYR